jgi:hypothetical protein
MPRSTTCYCHACRVPIATAATPERAEALTLAHYSSASHGRAVTERRRWARVSA